MIEILASFLGGALAFWGSWFGIKMQHKKQDKDRDKEYHNDLVSMIDIIIYRAAKVRNNELNEKHAYYDKENTREICQSINQDFNALEKGIEELVLLMSHHIDNSNNAIQAVLSHFEQLNLQFNKFNTATKIYLQKYGKQGYNTNSIVHSNINLDKRAETFINHMQKLALDSYNHKTYNPKLNELANNKE